MKKRILSQMLIAALLTGTLAGCGKGDTEAKNDGGSKDPVKVRYAFWDTAQQPYLEKCEEEFEKNNPEIDIILEASPSDEYWTKLEAGATGGSAPDVFWMNASNVKKYAEGDILMPLDDKLSSSESVKIDNYLDSMVDMYNLNGKQYAIPKDFDTIGVWYNKQIFDEAGVPYPEDNWTWEDMEELAAQLTKTDKSIYGIAAPYANQEGFYNTIYATGGKIVSEDGEKSGYDEAETQAGIQCWIELQKAGISPTQASLEQTPAYNQFLSGKLAMYWTGSWFLAQVLDSDFKESIDVAALPTIDGNKATVIHGIGNCVYSKSKNPEEAWKWVEFLGGKTANQTMAELGAAIPAYKGLGQLWSEKYPEYNLQSFIESSEEYSYPYPTTGNTSEWQQYEADNLKLAFNLEIGVKEACDKLAEQMNEVLKSE